MPILNSIIHFNGCIDNVMIFDRALSWAEVQALADAGNGNVFLYLGRLARTPYLRYLAII